MRGLNFCGFFAFSVWCSICFVETFMCIGCLCVAWNNLLVKFMKSSRVLFLFCVNFLNCVKYVSFNSECFHEINLNYYFI